MAERRPNRVIGEPHDEFWAACARGELRLQRCGACGHVTWPPRPVCERCDSDELTWAAMSGRGRIVSWCTFYQPYYAELPLPWETILVELEEGPLFISNPDGFGFDDIEAGMAVQLRFLDCEDDHGPFRLPVFARA